MTFITANTFPITITKLLSAIHCNLRSLQANFDRHVQHALWLETQVYSHWSY